MQFWIIFVLFWTIFIAFLGAYTFVHEQNFTKKPVHGQKIEQKLVHVYVHEFEDQMYMYKYICT